MREDWALADLDEVTLTVYVPEADLRRVLLGQMVEVTVVFAVKVRLDNANHRLKPGMPANAAFQ